MVLNNLTSLITIKSVKDSAGNILSTYTETNALDFLGGKVGASGAGYSRMEIGTNGSAAAVGNYQITTNASISRTALNVLDANRQAGEIINMQATFTNTGASSVIIKEIGIICVVSSSVDKDVLLCRKVLTNPITMEAGATYQINYSLKMNSNNES